VAWAGGVAGVWQTTVTVIL